MAKPGRKPKYGEAMSAAERQAEKRKWDVRYGWAAGINEIVARLSRENADRFLESRILPHYFLAALRQIGIHTVKTIMQPLGSTSAR